MSDDEFGLDDDVFDAADLAKIDQIEHKFSFAASQAPPVSAVQPFSIPAPPRPPVRPSQEPRARFIRPPPPKRIRTNEWNVTSVPNRDFPEDQDDTPPYAVVAQRDGKYRILDSADAVPRATSFAVPAAPAASQHSLLISASQQSRTTPSQRQAQGANSGSSYPRLTRSNVPSSGSVPRSYASSQARIAAIAAAMETNLSATSEDGDNEKEALLAKIAELQRANEAAERALRVAHEEKLTKEGEISTIRRTMANLKDSHAQTVAKVQAEKLATEEKRKQTEKQMKAEMERLQTNLALRRQELETSTRKPPWSARKHSVTGGPTPARQPSSHLRQPSMTEAQTPSRPARLKIGTSARDFNAKDPRHSTMKDAKGKGKVPAFHSFVDSFQSTSPVKTPSKSVSRAPASQRDVPRGRAASQAQKQVPDMETMFPPILHLDAPTPIRPRTLSFGVSNTQSQTFVQNDTETQEESGPDWATHLNEEESGASALDLDLARRGTGLTLEEEAEVRGEMLEEEEEEEEEEPLETLDLKEQLYRILFAHISLPLYHLTLQMLLSAHIPDQHPDQALEYVNASSALVQALAPRSFEYGTILQMVAKALMRLARILCDTSSMVTLAGMFNLLATMCLFLPRTTAALLPEEIDEAVPPALQLVNDVIKLHTNPRNTLTSESELLVKECLNFLEILSLTLPKDLLHQMRFVLAEPALVSHLLDGRQPLWVPQSTIRSISTLSTYEEASTNMLVPPRDAPTSKIPLLERLAYLLLETATTPSLKEQHSLQIPILTTFTQLAISSPDSLHTLVRSQALIPALVATLNNYSVRVWEEDENLYEEEALLMLTHIIQGTLRLLHYLVFQGGPEVDLQYKIQYPPPKMNGLEHMFVVGLGRLSYADPPEWQSKTAKEALENGAVLARDLLENVVDGPEVDIIWTTFQDSEENQGSDTDDEEMEARKVAQTDDDMILVD